MIALIGGALAFGAVAGIGSGIEKAIQQKKKCKAANKLIKNMKDFQSESLKDESYINAQFEVYKGRIDTINTEIAGNLKTLVVLQLSDADELTRKQISLTIIVIFVAILLILNKRKLLTETILIVIIFCILLVRPIITAIYTNAEYSSNIKKRVSEDTTDGKTGVINYDDDINLAAQLELKNSVGKIMYKSFLAVFLSILLFLVLYFIFVKVAEIDTHLIKGVIFLVAMLCEYIFEAVIDS